MCTKAMCPINLLHKKAHFTVVPNLAVQQKMCPVQQCTIKLWPAI